MISTPMLGTREKVSPSMLNKYQVSFYFLLGTKKSISAQNRIKGGLYFHYSSFLSALLCVFVSLQNDSYAFVDYSANSYYLNPIDLTNLGSPGGLGLDCSTTVMVGGHPLTMALESSSGRHHPPMQHPSATATISSGAAGGSDLDINVIKDRLMTTRVPESCVWPVTNGAAVHRVATRFPLQSSAWILLVWPSAAATTYLFRLKSLYIHSTSLLYSSCVRRCALVNRFLLLVE